MLFASIDIGSNAGRLLITNVYERYGRPFTDKASIVRVPLRLGLDVFERGYISEERIEYLLKTLRAFKLLIDVYQPNNFAACSTAAMREAENKDDILELIKKETGIEIGIISGSEEAKIISKANNANFQYVYDDTLYIDVGGGSTEISYFKNERFVKSKSFNIGTIRVLLEKVSINDWNELEHWIKRIRAENGEVNCICSGGNINKLTKLYGDVDNYCISKKQLSHAYDDLSKYSIEERIEKLGMRRDRADVIVPAAKIFRKITKWGKLSNLHAPRVGLADGLAIELYKNHLKEEALKKAGI